MDPIRVPARAHPAGCNPTPSEKKLTEPEPRVRCSAEFPNRGAATWGPPVQVSVLSDRQGVGVAMNSRRVRAGYDRHGREVGAVLDLSYGGMGPQAPKGTGQSFWLENPWFSAGRSPADWRQPFHDLSF